MGQEGQTGANAIPVPTHPLPNRPKAEVGPDPVSVISAEPQLRDFRKEAAAFVPRGVKKKKVAETVAPTVPIIDAAPLAPGPSAKGATIEPKAPTINAAPVDDDSDDSDGGYQLPTVPKKVIKPAGPPVSAYNPNASAFGGGLLGKLSSVLGTPAAPTAELSKPAAPKAGDDYKDFLAGLEKLS